VIIYLHGFNSSPQSGKAQHLKRYLDGKGKGAGFACPQLPHSPDEAVAVAEAEIVRREQITLVGSSLGGFYATWLAEKHGVRAVLINPAIEPHVGLRAYLGPQQAFHGGERYELTEEHLRQWKELFVTRVNPERYLLAYPASTNARLELGRGYYLRNFGIIFLSQFVIMFFLLLVSFILGFALAATIGIDMRASQLIGGFAGVLVAPPGLIILVLLYYDMRVRKEGYAATQLADDLRF